MEYTGVVQGVEIDDRQRRLHGRDRLAEGERHAPQNPQAFGEQLSLALHALQTSSSPESATVIVRPTVEVLTISARQHIQQGRRQRQAGSLELETCLINGCLLLET